MPDPAPVDNPSSLRHRLHEIIFEADTPLGKAFDVVLLISIVASVIAVILESVETIRVEHGSLLRGMEWGFTILFTIEYVTRLSCVRRPMRYALSFYGVVDLLSVLPTYLMLLGLGSQSLIVIRALRLLRVFRVFKLAQFLGEAQMLAGAIANSVRKILIFLGFVLTLILILGTLMYLVEGGDAGFTSIPQSMYWAVVTLTTVGYGDIAPQTVAGKLLASMVMMIGYAIIAVPTGIVTAELTRRPHKVVSTQACQECAVEGHHPRATFCYRCGAEL